MSVCMYTIFDDEGTIIHPLLPTGVTAWEILLEVKCMEPLYSNPLQ